MGGKVSKPFSFFCSKFGEPFSSYFRFFALLKLDIIFSNHSSYRISSPKWIDATCPNENNINSDNGCFI